MTLNNKIIKSFIYIIMISISFGMLIRIHYSFGVNDEPNYLALTHRLYCGDKLIIDEYHPTQFFAVILLPFYYIYKSIIPSGDGIILTFRFLFEIIIIATSFYCLKSLQKEYNSFISGVCSIALLIYSRRNTEGMSYYNLFVIFCILSYLILLNNYKHKRISFILCGITISLAVLCNPFFAPFIILIEIYWIFNKGTREQSLYIFIGEILSFFIFLCFFILPNDPIIIINSIDNIFISTDHGDIFRFLIIALKNTFIWFKMSWFYAIFWLLAFLFTHKTKADTSLKIYAFSEVLFALYEIYKFKEAEPGILYTIIVISMIPLFIICSIKKTIDKNSRNLFILGFIMYIAYGLASDTGVSAMTTGATIMYIASTIQFLKTYEHDVKYNNEKKLIILYSIISSVIIIFTSTLTRFTYIFNDLPLDKLVYKIEKGPAKGLYTNEIRFDQYNNIISVLNDIQEKNANASICVIKTAPWAYLTGNLKVSTYSTWETIPSKDCFKKYYDNHNYPDYILWLDDSVGGNSETSSPNKLKDSEKDEYIYNLLNLYTINTYNYVDLYIKNPK